MLIQCITFDQFKLKIPNPINLLKIFFFEKDFS